MLRAPAPRRDPDPAHTSGGRGAAGKGGPSARGEVSGEMAVVPRSAAAGSEANMALRGFQGSHLRVTAALMQP